MIKTFSKIWSFSGKRHASLVRSLLFSFLRSCFAAAELFAIVLTVKILNGQADGAVLPVVICAAVCIIGNFVTSYFEQTATMDTGFFMTADKRISIGNLLRRLPLGFYTDSSVGRVTAALSTTLSDVETASVTAVVGIVSGLFNALSLFVFMMFFDPRIGLIAGAGMVVYILVVGWQMRISRKNAPALQKAQTSLSEAALTFFQGIKVTKAFSVKNGDTALNKAIEESRRENLRLTDRSMPSQFAAGAVTALFESAIVILSLTGGISDVAHTVFLLIFSFMIYASLSQAGSMLSMIGMLDGAIDEVEKIERTKQLETLLPEQSAADNSVTFDRVSFAYGENEVLHNVSFSAPSGTVNAIIGPSGSGKTTLCELIPRFHEATSGTIKIGGADIRHIPNGELMKKIGMVFQQVYLFEDTVMNNIRFGKSDADESEVISAAKAARCHEFIMDLPYGYNTIIGEGGCTLSGGEKQRISIARALLKGAPIVILDEATSALDAENEKDVMAALGELTKNKTVLMIAHRIQTVRNADKIIALQNGEIVQQGSHDELLRQKGIYADFIAARERAVGWKIANKVYTNS